MGGSDRADDAVLRVRVDAGGRRVVTIGPLPDRPAPRVLVPVPAPWIQPGGPPGKTLSYAPNLAAARRARAAGGDDALLVSLPEGVVLEASTTAVLLVRGGILLAPDLDLGVVDSVSRRALLQVAAAAGIAIETGRLPLDVALTADEVLVVSALRRPSAVARIGDVDLPRDAPVSDHLATALDQLRRW